MSGWTKVIVATGILLVAMIGFNLALWRRLREARRLAALAAEEGDGGQVPPAPPTPADRADSRNNI